MTNDIHTYLAERLAYHKDAEKAPWSTHSYGHAGAEEPETIVLVKGEAFDWRAVTDGDFIAASPHWEKQESDNLAAVADAHNNLPSILEMLTAVLDLCDEAEEARDLGLAQSASVQVADIRNALEEVLDHGGNSTDA